MPRGKAWTPEEEKHLIEMLSKQLPAEFTTYKEDDVNQWWDKFAATYNEDMKTDRSSGALKIRFEHLHRAVLEDLTDDTRRQVLEEARSIRQRMRPHSRAGAHAVAAGASVGVAAPSETAGFSSSATGVPAAAAARTPTGGRMEDVWSDEEGAAAVTAATAAPQPAPAAPSAGHVPASAPLMATVGKRGRAAAAKPTVVPQPKFKAEMKPATSAGHVKAKAHGAAHAMLAANVKPAIQHDHVAPGVASQDSALSFVSKTALDLLQESTLHSVSRSEKAVEQAERALKRARLGLARMQKTLINTLGHIAAGDGGAAMTCTQQALVTCADILAGKRVAEDDDEMVMNSTDTATE